MPDLLPDADLDRLYWETDLPVAHLARRFGLAVRDVHRAVHPVDSGVRCYFCATSLAFTSRSARSEHRLRCQHCGATRANPVHADEAQRRRPAVVGGLIVVRDDGRDPGSHVDLCIGALAMMGLAWDEHDLVVLSARPSDGRDVLTALADHEVGTIAVTELTELAATQTGCLESLFDLLRRRWSVIVAHDVPGFGYRRFTATDLDHVDEPWAENVIDLTCRWDRRRPRW